MRKLISTLLFVALTISLSLNSCKKESEDSDPDYCSTAWSTEISSELTALTNAAMAYSNDPSTANCNAYKTSYQNYINALKPFLKCNLYTAAQKTELQNAIDDAEDDVATLCD